MDPSKGPSESFAYCHMNLSVRRGISNFEHLDLDVLSQEKVYAFLCTWAPLTLVGATGSPGNPLGGLVRARSAPGTGGERPAPGGPVAFERAQKVHSGTGEVASGTGKQRTGREVVSGDGKRLMDSRSCDAPTCDALVTGPLG
jgi:hypothetical protein